MQQTEKKRGRFLAVWLVLVPIVNSVMLFLTFTLISLTYESGQDMSALKVIAYSSVIVIILNIVSSVAVWKWKRWGVYGLGLMTLATAGVMNWPVPLFFFFSFVQLVEIVVLAILVRPIWKHLK